LQTARLLGATALVAVGTPLLAQQGAPDGQQIYASAGCSGCHGQRGNGGIGAAFRNNGNLDDTQLTLDQILWGGEKMPAFADQLSDAEIAAVASYIRTSFDNSFGPVVPQQVADAREGDGQTQTASEGDGASDFEDQAGGDALPGDGEGSEEASSDSGAMEVGAPAQDVRQPSSAGPDQQALTAASDATDSWLMYNQGYLGQRYSELDQINRDTLSELQPLCTLQLGTTMSFQASPIVWDGLIYVTTPYRTVAMDATTCEQVWSHTYTPTAPEPFTTNRGVAVADGRVFRGTTDAHFLALDAKTGELLWKIRPVDSSEGYFLSSAPIVWEDRVYTGTAGADWGAPAIMFAFDVEDGSTEWTFDQIVDETFGSAEAAATGGGSNWTSYSLDPETGNIYIPVGNPAPDFAADYRPGRNLYTNSALILDAETGELDHYYQQIPNDALDRDTAAAPVLFRLTGENGEETLYTAVGNKGGHLYLYNEETREQVYRVPVTTLENATAAPTTEGVHVCPGINGGVEWYGPAFDPERSALYVPAVDWCSTFTLGEVRYTPGQLFFGGSYTFDPVEEAQGWIRSFDAASGEEQWRYESELPVVAGVTPTAGGIVFAGELTGDFIVLDAETGERLWSYFTGGPIGGGISTYEIDGRQYVAVASGNASRTWSPDVSPAATMFIFGLPEGAASDGDADE
jgi:glucose dehydrogenase/cytochrome c553